MELPPDDDSGPTIPVGEHALKTPSRKISLAMEDQPLCNEFKITFYFLLISI